jgi:hypothetical protein
VIDLQLLCDGNGIDSAPSSEAIALVGRTRIDCTFASRVTIASAIPTPRCAASASGESTIRSGNTASEALCMAPGATIAVVPVSQLRSGVTNAIAARRLMATTAAHTLAADRGLPSVAP